MFGRKKDEDFTGLEPGADAGSGPRITAADIQAKVFNPQKKNGYSEAEVDEFLDQITEEFVRLQEDARRGRGGMSGSAGSSATADEIRKKAEAEAEAILADARARAAALTAGGTGAAPSAADVQPFLTQERDFLHSIAGMIQQHAETIRDMAKAAKEGTLPPGEPSGDDLAEPRSAAGSDDGGPGSIGSAARAVTGSAWAATTPTAAPEEDAAPSSADVVGQSSDRSVIQIPTSPVDAPPESASQAQPRAMTTEAVSDPVLESDADPAASAPVGDQRSLRELFWGED